MNAVAKTSTPSARRVSPAVAVSLAVVEAAWIAFLGWMAWRG